MKWEQDVYCIYLLMFPSIPMTSSYDQILAIMRKRCSIRYFSDAPVDHESLKKILEAGRISPSVENVQPWHFHVIVDTALKTKLMETSCYGNFIAGASVFIVITCDRLSSAEAHCILWNPKEMEYSCAMAAQSMMLLATSMNIGSCWVSLHHGPAHSVMQLEGHQVVVGGLMLGHMKKSDEATPCEHQRKPMESIVTYHEKPKKKTGR